VRPFGCGELGSDGVQDAFGDVNGDRVPDDLRKDIYNRRWRLDVNPDFAASWDTIPALAGTAFQILDIFTNSSFIRMSIDIPSSEPVTRTGGTNAAVLLTPLPSTPNHWYCGDRIGNWDTFFPQYRTDVWFYKPADGMLDIWLEIRDVHLNQLQPIGTVTGNRVMPAMTIILDIQ